MVLIVSLMNPPERQKTPTPAWIIFFPKYKSDAFFRIERREYLIITW